jgi:SAM-dependent methyltransferase
MMSNKFSTDVIGKAAEGRIRILDAGCGTGAQAFYLARQDASRVVYAYDISPTAIEKAQRYRQRLQVPNVFFIRASHDELQFENMLEIDMIYASDSLVGEYDLEAFRRNFSDGEEIVRRRLSKFRSMLNPNGVYAHIWAGNSVAIRGFTETAESCDFRLVHIVTGPCLDIEFRQDPLVKTGMIFEAI